MIRVCLLVAGLLIGAVLGYLTRPEAAELRIGGVSIEIQSSQPASGSASGGMTSGQWQHVGVFAVGGAAIGFLAGFAADRRRA